jgi:hypothetical protein
MFYYLTLSSSRLLSTDESLHEWLLDTLSDPQNETDCLNSSLRDDRNRSNSFDDVMLFDAILYDDHFDDPLSLSLATYLGCN